jgi:hypothetical protein
MGWAWEKRMQVEVWMANLLGTSTLKTDEEMGGKHYDELFENKS